MAAAGRDLNFHSFRHRVADAFRKAGFVDEEFAPLLGHTMATMTGKYGIVKPMVLAQRVAMIEAIEYPGLHRVLLRACPRNYLFRFWMRSKIISTHGRSERVFWTGP